MKTIKTLLAAALMMFSASAMAQATYEAADGTKYEFQKHAFLNLEAGAQYTLGEAKFSKLISPNIQIGLGYQFTPVFGARIQANAWQSKGGWNGFRTQIGAAPYTNDYKWKYVAPGIDFMFNLSNLFCGWNPNRVFNLTAFVGGGANIAWGNGEANDIANSLKSAASSYLMEYVWDGSKVRLFGRGGLEAAFKLSDAVALTIEGNANILSDKYNSKKAEKKMKADWYFNALLGVKIALGPTVKRTIIPAPVIEEPAPVVEEPKPVVKKPEPVVQKPEMRTEIFYAIRETVAVGAEKAKLDNLIAFLKANTDTKVNVTSYADAGTGNPRINQMYAAKRAENVKKALVEAGIAESRITVDSKGDTVQPFAENDKNRVSIAIAK